MAMTRPASDTAPALCSSASADSLKRVCSVPAQWVTGKREPNGLTPRACHASSFSRRRRICSLASAGFPPGGVVMSGLGGRPRRGQKSANERVEPSIHDRFHGSDLDAGAIVLDDLVRRERVGADLAAEGDLLLLPGQVGQLLLLLLLVDLEEPRLEDAHRGIAVPELRALVLAGNHHAARQGG